MRYNVYYGYVHYERANVEYARAFSNYQID